MPRNTSRVARDKARSARQDPSVAEIRMWKLLRNERIGFKFRREHPIGDYRLDFFCSEAMVDVEMEGEQHDPERDQIRDEWLAGQGIAVFRIPNRAFFLLDDGVCPPFMDDLIRLCEERSGRPAF